MQQQQQYQQQYHHQQYHQQYQQQPGSWPSSRRPSLDGCSPAPSLQGQPCQEEQDGQEGQQQEQEQGQGQGQGLALQLSWRQLAVHVLHPRLSYTHPGLTPFAFAAAGLTPDDPRERWVAWHDVCLHTACATHICLTLA